VRSSTPWGRPGGPRGAGIPSPKYVSLRTSTLIPVDSLTLIRIVSRMAKKPVTMSIREEDLSRLDEFALVRRLSRGDAVGVLLDSYVEPVPGVRSSQTINTVPLSPPVGIKDLRLHVGKKVLEATQEYVGVAPVSLEGEELVKGEPVPGSLDQFYKSKGPPLPAQRFADYDEFNQDDR